MAAKREAEGAVAVEFALLLALLAMILFGVIEFGRVNSQYQVLQGAAREGGRLAAVREPPDVVIARVYDAAEPYEPSTTPTIDKQCNDETSGEAVTVSWVQNFRLTIPFWKDSTVSRTIRGVFRCE